MTETERVAALVRATVGLRKAIMDPGPAPRIHYQVLGETFSRWPTLGRAIYDVLDKLDQVEKGDS